MAVSIFNSLIFGNIDSADYGIYITGESVYDAPERAVDMVKVPGRNGAIALDLGRWENIEVSYPAGCFGGDQSDFATRISDFRNAIVSQIGYQRLADTYNPSEYRMGVYTDGLDVKPAGMGRAGEFTIKFDCKPQRFLTSGETETTVSSGDALTNPTQYEASPLLMIEGYGNISFNGYDIDLENAVLGDVQLAPTEWRMSTSMTSIRNNNMAMLNTGDSITIQESVVTFRLYDLTAGWHIKTFDSISVSGGLGSSASGSVTGYNNMVSVKIPPVVFQKGTSASYTDTITINCTSAQDSTPSNTHSGQISVEIFVSVTAGTAAHVFRIDYGSTTSSVYAKSNANEGTRGKIIGYSTQSILGHPTYIDCDLGEAYRIVDNEYMSLNGKIELGSDLPTLAPGENEVTFDNTITELKIKPRWWKL